MVVRVLAAYRSTSSDSGATPALILALDPPHYVWDGVTLYHHLRAKVREHETERREQERKRKHGAR